MVRAAGRVVCLLVGALAGRGEWERLRRRLTTLAGAGTVSVPVWRGDRCFFARRGPGQDHAVLLTAGRDGAERTLIDPSALDPSGSVTLDGWFPSPDGELLAYLISEGGTEQAVLRVMDVATGEAVDGPIDRTSHSVVAWLPGGTAFCYRRLLAESGQGRFNLRLYLHRVGTSPDHDILVFGQDLPPRAYPEPAISRDGRWLLVCVDYGPLRGDIYLADLHADGIKAPQLRAVQHDAGGFSAATVGRDGRLYVLTTVGAPNRRLCVAAAGHPDPNGWQTLLPEDPEAVLNDVVILDGADLDRPLLLAQRSRHAVSELTLHDLATGELVGSVSAPGPGTVTQLREHPDGGPCAWFCYTDFRTPPGVWRFDARTREVTVWSSSPGVTAGAVHVRQVTYASRDKTVVRMFILSPAGQPDRPRPAILYAYGTFGHARTPAFDPFRLAWVEAGGVYAIANVRGGGEEGEAWHRAGMKENRQNTFDDVHAAAGYLVDHGWTSRPQLGIHGGSAGAQVAAMALIQRPDAYAAALCSAPAVDMVRAELSGTGALAVIEFGSARNPQELGWLLAQSPYHRVRRGAGYPAVLLTASDADTRVNSLHARKFAAALQHATSAPAAEKPILLRREDNVGHTGRPLSRSIPLWLDQLGFFARQLGLGDDELPAQPT